MKGNKTIDNNEGNVNKSQRSAKSEAEIRSKLEKEIRQLNSLVCRLECRAEIRKFGDAKIVASSDITDASLEDGIIDIDAQLKNELYRFAGFYCVKHTEDEYVFNFSPSHKYEKKNTFAVQILKVNGKGHLGKWVMPMSVDLDELKSKYNIKNLDNVMPFLRTCKNYIDSYYSRLEQFQKLTKNISGMKNCNLQSNLGYTRFTLEFQGVHNVENDYYMDLIVYLMYDGRETRPSKVRFELKRKIELNKEEIKYLKSSLKSFKDQDLNSAFEHIFMENNDKFSWSRESDRDSPIDLSNLSNSDEEEFLGLYPPRNQLSMMTRERKQRIQRRKKRVPRTSVNKNNETNSSNTATKFVRARETRKRSENMNSISLNKEKEPITETPTAVVVTSMQRKQRKLRFQQDEVTDKTSGIISLEDSNRRSTSKNTEPKLVTSTPHHGTLQNTFKLIASTSWDISDIATNEDIPRKITRHRNVAQTDKVGQRGGKNKRQISRRTRSMGRQKNTNIKSFMPNVQKEK